MKRKLSTLLLALAVACALAAPALADAIWEPQNGFYQRNRESCTYVGRSYLTNGKSGYVTLLDAPHSFVEVYNVPNGESVHVSFSWEDSSGAQWACCEYAVRKDGGYDWKSGWVSMSGLALIYDETCFREDHGAQIARYDGSGDALEAVCLYSYPGGVYSHTLPENRDYCPFADAFDGLYTDENGRRWSFIGYYMGHQNGWACLDDPLNEHLGIEKPMAALEVRGPQTFPTDGQTGAADRNSGGDAAQAIIPPAEHVPAAKTGVFWVIPAALVAVVAAGTAVLVGLGRKKRVNPS